MTLDDLVWPWMTQKWTPRHRFTLVYAFYLDEANSVPSAPSFVKSDAVFTVQTFENDVTNHITWRDFEKKFNAKRCAKDRKSASQNVGFLSLIANPSAPINWQGGVASTPPHRARVKGTFPPSKKSSNQHKIFWYVIHRIWKHILWHFHLPKGVLFAIKHI